MAVACASCLCGMTSHAFAAGGASAIKWEKRGTPGGKPVIFLPGLGLTSQMWDRIAPDIEKSHPVFLGTYAGNGGVPSIEPPYLDKFVEAVKDLVESEKLDKPIVVGHLIGGHVALRVAGQYPTLLGGVVSMPVLTHRPPLDQRKEEAEKVKKSYDNIPDELWEPELRLQVRSNLDDPKTVDVLVAMLVKADRKMYSGIIAEMVADELETFLPKIKVPVLLITALDAPNKAEAVALRDMRMNEFVRNVQESVRGIYAGIERCDVQTIRYARTFCMYEQPDRFLFALNRFIKKVDDPNARWQTTVGSVAAPTSAPELYPTSRVAPDRP